MNAIEQLKSVLCDPTGKCCIKGSEEDRAIVDRALQALAQPEQEPVAWSMFKRGRLESFWMDKGDAYDYEFTSEHEWKPLYTTPPQRTWVGLTEEDLKLLSAEWRIVYGAWMDDFAKDIEAKLKEKNFD